MAQITYDVFDGGLDVRKSIDSAGANQLPVLTNAYITTGKEIKKRPCLTLVATLELGTFGLKAALGKLNTFYSTGVIAHANPLFQANFVPHPTSTVPIAFKVHALEVFGGYLYASIEYDNGDIKHHYLDDPGGWTAATALALGAFRKSTSAVGAGFRYEVTTAGTTGGAEPAWPSTVGSTVVDGTVTWTCRSFAVTDTNCPNSAIVMTSSDKIFSAKDSVMRFSAVAKARDWSAPGDAGFKSVGTQQTGLSEVTALAPFQDKIAVFFADGCQVWTSDPDPANINLYQRIYNIGTRYSKTPVVVGGDTFFLSDQGFRSLTIATQLLNLQDVDVGAPIDSLVKPTLVAGIDPLSAFFPGLGQWWFAIGSTVWAYTFSRSSKVATWSKFTFGVPISAMAQLDGRLYIRSVNNVYLVDELATSDNGSIPLVEIELPFQDGKAPGILKMLTGMDVLIDGTADVSIRYDPNDLSKVTDVFPMVQNTTPGSMQPLELCTVEMAPRITHQADEAFTLKRLIFYFERLGAL